MSRLSEKRINRGEWELFSEAWGKPGDPAVLLIMGAMASSFWWPEGLCERVAARGRFVIRFDARDTGRSTNSEPGKLTYGVEDLADDAVSVLDAWGVKSAGFVGMSLGGYLSQLCALKSPDRVRSLTLIASEPLITPDPSVPGMDPKITQFHANFANLDWSDLDAVTDYRVAGWKLLSGSQRPPDDAVIRDIATRDVKATRNLTSSFNHALLPTDTRVAKWYDRLGELRVPTVVIHGTEDPVLPYPHALRLVKEIPGAKLVTLEGAGHELHPTDWGRIANEIALVSDR